MSTTSKFNDMVTSLRNDIEDKTVRIKKNSDRQEKDMIEYQEFIDFLKRKEKIDLRKKKIASIIND